MELISTLLLLFMQAPSQFRTGQSQVLYASTFLKGSAAHWFSNFLIQQPPPRVVTNWNIFVRELNAMFGDRNRVRTAQQAVLTLQMNNNHQVSHYVVEPSMGPLRDLVFMAHAAAPVSFVSPHTDTYRLPLISSISLSTVRLSLLILLCRPRRDSSVSASSYSALVSCSTSAQ